MLLKPEEEGVETGILSAESSSSYTQTPKDADCRKEKPEFLG